MKNVIRQKFVYREDLQTNPHILYLFGDNYERIGMGGQAKEMRGEKNAVGIRTKRSPDYNHDSFLYDNEFDQVKIDLFDDFGPVVEHIKNGGLVVIPTDGLGTGLSRLPETAPLILEEIEAWISYLETL